MTYLRYLRRRFKTAWTGDRVCHTPRCGRPNGSWMVDHCEAHRGA